MLETQIPMTTGSRSTRNRPRGEPTRSRDEVKHILNAALRHEFPHDTVDISDGYRQNIHILVVSRRFDAIPAENDKQNLLWDIIDKTSLTAAEKRLISLVLPVSPALLK